MGWIIFMISVWVSALLIVPLRSWRKSWPVGIFGLACIYVLDNTLAGLGAFKFWHGGIYLSGLPLFYWVSYFPGGILFDYLRPHKHGSRLVYMLIIAAAYLIIELVMVYVGYFQYVNWNIYRAYLLNLVGFTVSMWFAEWVEQGKE